MFWQYRYTPDLWPPLVGALLLAALALYSWQHRDVPAALPLAAASLFGALWLSGIGLEASAVTPALQITWFKFQAAWQLPTATAVACFALEYAYPGRWLTRRNLALIALPALLVWLIIVTNDAHWMWREIAVGPDGMVVRIFAIPGAILLIYGISLILVDMTAFLWLFFRSPQHRWPAGLMLIGDIVSRGLHGLYVLGVAQVAGLTLLDAFIVSLLVNWAIYAIAVFAFRIFDPLPAARALAIAQMQDGLVACDMRWRVASLNPAAASFLAASAARARGRPLPELLPALADRCARLTDTPTTLTTPAEQSEIILATKAGVRQFAVTFSRLHDFRGLPIGHLLLLRDVTEQRQAQAQALAQQAAVTALRERELMARDLHDGLGQVLGYVKLQAQAARCLLTQNRQAEADAQLARLVTVAQDAHAEMRDYILEASGAAPLEQGFCSALQQYLQRFSQIHPIHTVLDLPPGLSDARFEPAAAAQLLRIVQEALTNARKHAHAGEVRISLAARDGTAEVTITDDGLGFDPAQPTGDGFGLRFMRERAQAVGGSLQVQSATGRGTTIIVRVPLRKDGNA